MRQLRSAAFFVYLVAWTIVLSVGIPWLAFRAEPARIRRFSRVWSRGVAWGLSHIVGLSYREIGRENLPAGPALYVVNHQSAWETLVLNLLIPDVAFVLKEELYRYPIFGWYLRRAPMIAIDRAGGASAMKKMFREGRAAAEGGRSVLIFPEGTRRSMDEPADFHRGVLALYKVLRLPAVPVAHNAGHFWKPRSLFVTPGIVTVSYLPPVPPGLPDTVFMEAMQGAIFAERDRLAALPGDRS